MAVSLVTKAGDNIFLIVNKSYEKTNNELILQICIVCVSKAWCILFLCAIELHCHQKSIKNTSVSHTVALGEMSCCCKYSLEHQICIISQLKVVPNRFTIYSCLSLFVKKYCTQLFEQIVSLYFLKMKVKSSLRFMSSVETNVVGPECRRQV